MVDVVTLLKAQLGSERGVWLVATFIGLALLYPRFGYVRRIVEDVDIEGDRIRIDNAMKLYGFKFAGTRDGRLVYRAEGIIRRITLLFEDEVVVEQIGDEVVISGHRRTVVRAVIRLEGYLVNKRRGNE
jgi:hypothetical protein